MEFANFDIFRLIIFIIVLLFTFFVFYKKIKNQNIFNKKYKGIQTIKYFYIKYIFLILSFVIVFLSIFGIKGGFNNSVNTNKGIDIVFVLDVSKSMNVADIKNNNSAYTRLDVIKDSISKYISSNIENRYSLIILAGDAISTLPLTFDHDIFLSFLHNVDYRNLLEQGSDFNKALNLGIYRFEEGNDRSKALIFISDGGDIENNISASNIKKIAGKKEGISYFVVGVGTESGGKIIKGTDDSGRIIYQKYKNQYVISKINRSNLKNISKNLDGEYFEVNKIDDLLKLNEYIKKLEKKSLSIDSNGNKNDMGRYLAFISFVFFILYFVLYFFEDKIYFLIKNYEK